MGKFLNKSLYSSTLIAIFFAYSKGNSIMNIITYVKNSCFFNPCYASPMDVTTRESFQGWHETYVSKNQPSPSLQGIALILTWFRRKHTNWPLSSSFFYFHVDILFCYLFLLICICFPFFALEDSFIFVSSIALCSCIAMGLNIALNVYIGTRTIV